MSERELKKSDGFNSEDEKLADGYDLDNDIEEIIKDYYLDDEEDIEETDEDYFLDEINEEDEDYFLDEEEDADTDTSPQIKEIHKRTIADSAVEENDTVDYLEEDLVEDADIFEDEPKTKNNKNRRRKGRKMKKLWIILGCIAAALVIVYVGVSVFFNGHFFLNTEINGHDFSGKTTADVEEYLKEQVKGYELKVLEKDNKSDTIKGSDISLEYKENNEIKEALENQNGFLWPASIFSDSSKKVTIQVSYDKSALDNKVQELQAVTAEQVPAKSAYPKFNGDQFVVEPEVIGSAVNLDALNEKVHQYISEFKTELDMEKEKCYAVPTYTSESEEVKKACETMNNYTKSSITYTMTEAEVVDKTLISTWLSVDDKMNVIFDEEAVKAWLTGFGDKYDTVGATRSITTPTGKTVEVSGGTYGWSIDEDTEFEALTASIKNGETISKEPAYYQTAAAHAAADWGNTYAEVDLAAQHMWYIVDGAVVLETDVVTGAPVPEKETPSGVYDILEIQRDKTLVGAIVPETGKPEYETPVTFWMRITWTGIGFHDANWQPAFGGALYQSVGSHGCINMPYDQAEALFNMLSVGTPVIMHY
jgi:lipoprotein-anchoring transpeptidase ErfK/SrfK/flagellar basal body-associated protein FliL